MQEILVLYYSQPGSVRAQAKRIACGIESPPGMQTRLRTVPEPVLASSGGTPYGPSRAAGAMGNPALTEGESRLAAFAQKLS